MASTYKLVVLFAWLFSLLLRAKAGRELQQTYTYDGTILVFSAELGNVALDTILLEPSSGPPKRLVFAEDSPAPESISSGNRVRVLSTSPPSSNTIYVRSLSYAFATSVIDQPASITYFAPTPPPNIATAYLLVSLCGVPTAATAQELESVVFRNSEPLGRGGDVSLNATYTLEDYFASCSYNKSTMTRTNSIIVDEVVVPCSGLTSYNVSWTASSCTYDDYIGWGEAASFYANQQLGVNLSNYMHRVLVLPKGLATSAGCTWVGMATVGLISDVLGGRKPIGLTWIPGDYWQMVQTYFHEMGHHLGLNHAAVGKNLFGDYSSAMGYCCRVRCFNAPHNWQAGWAKPVAVLDASSLATNTPLTFTLPAQHLSDTNMIVLVTDWAEEPHTLWISYRPLVSMKYDAEVLPAFKGGVLVHLYDGQQRDDAQYTYFQARLHDGTMWNDPSAGAQLVVRQLSSTEESAVVQVCRWVEVCEASCGDGQDNDCDGLIDALDPDCQHGCLVAMPSPPLAPLSSASAINLPAKFQVPFMSPSPPLPFPPPSPPPPRPLPGVPASGHAVNLPFPQVMMEVKSPPYPPSNPVISRPAPATGQNSLRGPFTGRGDSSTRATNAEDLVPAYPPVFLPSVANAVPRGVYSHTLIHAPNPAPIYGPQPTSKSTPPLPLGTYTLVQNPSESEIGINRNAQPPLHSSASLASYRLAHKSSSIASHRFKSKPVPVPIPIPVPVPIPEQVSTPTTPPTPAHPLPGAPSVTDKVDQSPPLTHPVDGPSKPSDESSPSRSSNVDAPSALEPGQNPRSENPEWSKP